MIAGIDKYFRSITIQRPTSSTNAWGGDDMTFGAHLTVQGLIRQLHGNEVTSGQKDQVVATHRMYCRLADIKVTDRVVYNTITYEITSVNNVMNFDELLQVDLWQLV